MTSYRFKDDRESTLQPVPEGVTSNDYRRLLQRARSEQLELSRENLNRLAQTYDRAANAILDKVRALPDGVERTGIGWLQAQLTLLRDIDETMIALRRDFGDLLDLSLLSTAQQVAEREAEVATLVGAPPDPRLAMTLSRSAALTDGTRIAVRFGTLAQSAVERTASRYYSDGLNLSQRLYTLDVEARKVIEDTILQGIAQGTSARNLAKELEANLMEAGAKNPRNRAMLIAQTEINTAHREAAIRATLQPNGLLKSYISAVGWRLSTSHKELDRCDLYAAHDEGLGAGNFRPENVPLSHPRCLCAVVSILAAFPDEQFVAKEPDAAGVPESELRRLARENDPVAIAALNGRVAA